ncbi:MAG TPA: hypothetical protein PLV45_00185 [bacterium]|nr:hypothetical protein [bacterium]
MTNPRKNNAYIWGLAAVLTAAALIRCHHAFHRGLSYWDEGIFIMGARFVRWRSGVLWLEFRNMIGDQLAPALPGIYRGLPVFLQKPAHVLLLTLWTLPGWNEISAAVTYSINWGLVSIWATATIGRRWFSPAAGLIAAAWLAFQPYHVHYSRLALHETDSMALFLLTLLSWHSMHDRGGVFRGVRTGALAMLTLGTSYRYLPLLVLGVVFELVITIRAVPWPSKWIVRWLALLAGGIAVFTILNGAYAVAFNPDYLWSQPGSYLEVLRMKFLGSETSFDVDYPLFYLDMMRRFDGGWMCAAGCAAVIFLILSRKTKPLILCTWIIVPLALYSLTTTRVPRTISCILPFWALAAGYALSRVFDHPRFKAVSTVWRGFAIGMVLILVAISALPSLQSIWALRSGYVEVVHWLENQSRSTHLSTMPPVYAVYQGRHAVMPVPFTLDEIIREVESTGVRYLTVDWQKFLRYSQGVHEIEKAVLPVYAAPHNTGVFFASLYENHLPGDVKKLQEDPTLAYVKVYDLYAALREMGYSTVVPEQ